MSRIILPPSLIPSFLPSFDTFQRHGWRVRDFRIHRAHARIALFFCQPPSISHVATTLVYHPPFLRDDPLFSGARLSSFLPLFMIFSRLRSIIYKHIHGCFLCSFPVLLPRGPATTRDALLFQLFQSEGNAASF